MDKRWSAHQKLLYIFYKNGESGTNYYNTPFAKYVDVYVKCLIDNYGELITLENIKKLLQCTIKAKLTDNSSALGLCFDNHKISGIQKLRVNNSVTIFLLCPNNCTKTQAIRAFFDIQEKHINGEISSFRKRINHDDEVYFKENYLGTLFHELTHVACLDQDAVKVGDNYFSVANFDKATLKKKKIYRFQNGSLIYNFKINDDMVCKAVPSVMLSSVQEGMTEMMAEKMCKSKMYRDSMKALGLPHVPNMLETYVPYVEWTKLACSIYPEYYDLYFKGVNSQFFNSDAEEKFTYNWFNLFYKLEMLEESLCSPTYKHAAKDYAKFMVLGAEILHNGAKDRLIKGEIDCKTYENIKKQIKDFLHYDNDFIVLNSFLTEKEERYVKAQLSKQLHTLSTDNTASLMQAKELG